MFGRAKLAGKVSGLKAIYTTVLTDTIASL